MVLLNNDFSSIVVAIEMGRLVFDNLKKVIIYLMPVRLRSLHRTRHADSQLHAGRILHRVCGRLYKCVPRNAVATKLVPSSLLLYPQRRSDVHIIDV